MILITELPLQPLIFNCLYVCVQCLQRPEEDIGSSGARVTSDSKLLIMGPGDRTLVSAGSASALNCQAIFPTPLSCLIVKKKIMLRIFLLQLYFVNYVYCSFVFTYLKFLCSYGGRGVQATAHVWRSKTNL